MDRFETLLGSTSPVAETLTMTCPHKLRNQERAKWRKPKAIPGVITFLPGEIRNLIFEYCIANALNSAKAKSRAIGSEGFTIDALPLWTGPSRIRSNGIGPLPLLFVNKKIFSELSSLLYSKVNQVSLGGYIMQYRGEDPSHRWAQIFPLLQNRPCLQQYTKSLKIVLPVVRTDMLYDFQLLPYNQRRRHLAPTMHRENKPWTVIPKLVEFAQTFPNLSRLQIVITMDQERPPSVSELAALLPLWDICKEKTIVTIKSPSHPGFRTWTLQWHANWEYAWRLCLAVNGRNSD